MAMKYRQHGYKDSEHEDDRDKPRQPRRDNLTQEEKYQRRSLRHATNREANEVVRCPTCGRGIDGSGAIMSDTTCPHCQAAIHCCRACRHFDSGTRFQCRAEITERVDDKNRANQCSHYEPRLVLDSTGRRAVTPTAGGSRPSSNDPKSQFENLFKR